MASNSDPKREAILAASFAAFQTFGFRRTSMEDIARATGVSRASLYNSFANKEEIFRALSESLHEETLSAGEQILKGEGTLLERVGSALEVRILQFLQIVHNSPHGAEIIDENSRSCGDVASRSGERFQKLVANAFNAAARNGEIDLRSAGLTAREAAEVVCLAAAGLKQGVTDPEAFRARLHRFLPFYFSGLEVSLLGRKSNRKA